MSSETMTNAINLTAATVTSISETTSHDILASTIKSIADQGATIVITAIVLIFLGSYLKSVLKRENDVIYGILPKLTEINTTIKGLQKSVNDVVGSHNMRANQSFNNIERAADDIKDGICDENEILREICNRLTALENNYNTLFKLFLSYVGTNNNRNILPSVGEYHEVDFKDSDIDTEE